MEVASSNLESMSRMKVSLAVGKVVVTDVSSVSRVILRPRETEFRVWPSRS